MEKYSTTPQQKQTIASLWRLEKIILDTLDFTEVTQKVCNSVLTELGQLNLGYRIIVLVLADHKSGGLRRIAISQTAEAKNAVAKIDIPFHDVVIPFEDKDNLCAKVYREQKPSSTHYWPDILTPPLSPENALLSQRTTGIKTSLVYPVIAKGKSLGVMIFSMIKDLNEISVDEQDLINGYTDVVGIAVQNAQLYTDLEKTTERLNKANERLKTLDKLKDEFLSIASHELRTPMTAIKSYLWMVLNKKQTEDKISPKTQKYLDRAYQSTERLISLVNDMLDVSRIEGGRVEMHPEMFNIVELADEVREEVNAKAMETNLTVSINKSDNIPQVYADKNKIHEVLLNLIGNALKFTPENGRIDVSFEKHDNMLYISVKDTGVGMSKEDIPKLFAKFGRLEGDLTAVAKTKGTGLGLYISKKYIEMLKGKIWVESKVGEGSTFTFSLPTEEVKK